MFKYVLVCCWCWCIACAWPFHLEDVISDLTLGWPVQWFNSVASPSAGPLLGTCRSASTPTGQCGLQVSQADSDSFVMGISPGLFGGLGNGIMSVACGRCFNVTALSGPRTGASIVAAALDVIPQATQPQLDLPINAFVALGGQRISATEGAGNMQVSAAWVTCPADIMSAMRAAPWVYNNNQSDAFWLTAPL